MGDEQVSRATARRLCFNLRRHFGRGRKLLVGRRSLVGDIELKHHVMFESFGLGLVGHCGNRRHTTESCKECPPVDFHSFLRLGFRISPGERRMRRVYTGRS